MKISRTVIQRIVMAVFLSALVAACFRGGDVKLAQKECGYYFHEISVQCVEERFGPRSSLAKLSDYMEAAAFSYVGTLSDEKGGLTVWHREDDYEKGPRESLILVRFVDDEIAAIKFTRWLNSSWRGDSVRPKSPYAGCLKRIAECKVRIDG